MNCELCIHALVPPSVTSGFPTFFSAHAFFHCHIIYIVCTYLPFVKCEENVLKCHVIFRVSAEWMLLFPYSSCSFCSMLSHFGCTFLCFICSFLCTPYGAREFTECVKYLCVSLNVLLFGGLFCSNSCIASSTSCMTKLKRPSTVCVCNKQSQNFCMHLISCFM